jgi:hypothetical protein
MADLKDLPVIGRAVAVIGSVGDLVLTGGDLLLDAAMGLVLGIVGNPELVVAIISTLKRLAGPLNLPLALLEQLSYAALVGLAVVYVGRLLQSSEENQ